MLVSRKHSKDLVKYRSLASRRSSKLREFRCFDSGFISTRKPMDENQSSQLLFPKKYTGVPVATRAMRVLYERCVYSGFSRMVTDRGIEPTI